jgi:nucleoside 2-deoxyribosyltransferase
MFKPDHTPCRIYCAGPLFNPSECAEMEMLAETLEQAGFKTFLPHRDGFLFGPIVADLVKSGYALDVAQWMVRRAIFALDVYQVLMGCDAIVVNLNGRVPDEGAVSEGAMAWTAGKAVVLFKDDARSEIDGFDNPLVAGLGGFRLVRRCEELAQVLSRALAVHPPESLRLESVPAIIRPVIEQGQCLLDDHGTRDSGRLIHTIIELFDEFRDTRSAGKGPVQMPR